MSENPETEERTVGPRAGLGAGIIGLGVLLIALPAVVDSLPAAQSELGAAPTLAGMMVRRGLVVSSAGGMSYVVKD